MRRYWLAHEHLGGGLDLYGEFDTKAEALAEAEPGAFITTWEFDGPLPPEPSSPPNGAWKKVAEEEIPWDGIDRRFRS